MRRRPRWPAALLVILALAVFQHAPWAGLHLDDHGFHRALAHADAAQFWKQFWLYVPGRNLHILYTWLLYKVLGPSPTALHLFGLALDAANACLAWSLALRLGTGAGGALLVSGLFLVFPNHGETHFWTSAIAMNLLSTTFILASALAACSGSMLWSLVLFALALFDYDQAFLMWVPILLCLNRAPAEGAQRRRRGAAFAAAAAALCVTHVALRHGAPAGSNPTVRLGTIGLRAAEAVAASAAPIVRLPAWETLHSFWGGPAATLALAAGLAAAWVWGVCRLWRGSAQPAGKSLAGFGAAWWLSAYFPNFFWHIDPRHHYLPSFGLLLLLHAGVVRLLARRPSAAGALAAAGFIFFGVSSALALGQGWSWKTSWELLDRFAARAPALLGASPESLFLHGAPRRVAAAPAFALTSEHLVAFAHRTGHEPRAGAVTLTPTRTGLFSGNYPEIFDESHLWWTPLASARVIVYGPHGALSCARALNLDLPNSRSLRLALDPRPGCSAEPRLWIPVWLESSRRVAPPGPPLSAIPGGPALHSAAAEIERGLLRLRLHWSGAAQRDFALIFRIYDRSGKLLFKPVYREQPQDPGSARLVWPLFNDLIPASTWKKGTAVEETYLLRLPAPLPAGPAEARFEVLERAETGAWPRIGEVRAAVKL